MNLYLKKTSGSKVVSPTAKEVTEKDHFCTFLHVQKSSVLSVSKQYVSRTNRMDTVFYEHLFHTPSIISSSITETMLITQSPLQLDHAKLLKLLIG